MVPIRIIIADDHELILDGLRSMLKKVAEIELVDEASNGEQLLASTRKLQPDVVLTDVKMPKLDGIQATMKIKEEFPHIGIIALSSYDEQHLIIEMLNAGAKGYLLKTSHKDEIIKAIKAVYKDEVYYCANTNARLADMISRRNSDPLRKDKMPCFTERELQVIEFMCKGLPSKLIADKLGLSKRTVERYRDVIMEKMDVHNATAAVSYAITHKVYIPVK
jgi:DNA-binding NarL/FixJ family response regulator